MTRLAMIDVWHHPPSDFNSLDRGVVFLDREGCVNENDRSSGNPDLHLITEMNEFYFRPGSKRAIRELTIAGWPIVVISNQEGVERGFMEIGTLKDISLYMAREIWSSGGQIIKAYYCPHDPAIPCECRKPKPTMLLQAAKDLGIILEKSYMIGDNPTDIIAGNEACCTTVHIPLNFCPEEDKIAPGADYIAEDLLDAVDIVLGRNWRKKEGKELLCQECNQPLIKHKGTGCYYCSNPNCYYYFRE